MTRPSDEEIVAELRGAHESLKTAEVTLAAGIARATVTAAYYAMYHAAKAAVWLHGKDAKTHGGLAKLFHQECIVPGEIEAEYFKLFNRGRDERQAADYDMVTYEVTQEEAAQLLMQARRFVKRIEKLVRETRARS